MTSALKGLAQGQVPPPERKTVGRYLASWLEDMKPSVRTSTWLRYGQIVAKHLVPELGTVRLSRLTPQAVNAALARRAATGSAPKTVAHIRGTLRSALTDAIEARLIPYNPASHSRPPRVAQHDVTPIAPLEARALLAVFQGTELEALVAMALYTGARQGELLALKWSDVDLDLSKVHIGRSLQRPSHSMAQVNSPVPAELKTAKSRRTLPLPGPARDLLITHRARQDDEKSRLGLAWAGSRTSAGQRLVLAGR